MARNVEVGACECPFKGCTRQVPVFRFRQRSDDPKRRRLGGKLYGECPEHGRFVDQEWLLERVTWHDEKAAAGDTGQEPERGPAAPVKQSPEPVKKTQEKAALPPVRQSPEKSSAPPEAERSDKGSGWGFF